MLRKTLLVCFCGLSLMTFAGAQTKIAGSAQCGKPDVEQKVDVPDHPGHSLAISQMKCTWTKPFEIAGVQSKEGVDSGVADVHAKGANSHGYYVDTMANGDKAFVRWQGRDMEANSEGKWTYAGGTGKFKGLQGGGTYKGKRSDDGSVSFDIEGEYTLPQ